MTPLPIDQFRFSPHDRVTFAALNRHHRKYDRRWPYMIVGTHTFQGPANIKVVIEDGFRLDFASIPQVFHSILRPVDPDLTWPSMIHDALYRRGTMSREMADIVMRDCMRVLGAPEWKVQMVYRGLQLGGRCAWNKIRDKQKRGLGNVDTDPNYLRRDDRPNSTASGGGAL